MTKLQERIKERRLSLNLTLLEVAEAIGVKEATVQRYESGEIKNIKHETIVALAGLLQCSPQYLMGWSDFLTDEKQKNRETFVLSKHEKNLIIAYRKRPDRHDAVDTLLGISESDSDELRAECAVF